MLSQRSLSVNPVRSLPSVRSTREVLAGSAAAESSIKAKADGVIEFDDLRSIPTKDQEGNDCEIVISRTTEMRITDPKTKLALSMHNIPYGALLYAKDKSNVEKGTLICTWDPHKRYHTVRNGR